MNFAKVDTVEKTHSFLDSDISLRENTRRALAAHIEDTTVDIDLEKHLITHYCPAWSRPSLEEQFCPHVARLFLSIKPEKARHVLALINSDLNSWRFNSKLPVEFPTYSHSNVDKQVAKIIGQVNYVSQGERVAETTRRRHNS
jgi:hypothetical protein